MLTGKKLQDHMRWVSLTAALQELKTRLEEDQALAAIRGTGSLHFSQRARRMEFCVNLLEGQIEAEFPENGNG